MQYVIGGHAGRSRSRVILTGLLAATSWMSACVYDRSGVLRDDGANAAGRDAAPDQAPPDLRADALRSDAAQLDQGRDSRDTSIAPDNALPPDDGVPQPDAPLPPPLDAGMTSCDVKYGKTAGYKLCDEGLDYCTFFYSSSKVTCNDLCGAGKGSCLGSWDSTAGACTGGSRNCWTMLDDGICKCSR